MELPSNIIDMLFLIILLIMSAFFSMSETALTSVNKVRIRSLMDSGSKKAINLDEILSDKSKLLSTILVGNNLANIGASVLATTLMVKYAGDNSYIVGGLTFLLTMVILIFSEIIPKTLALKSSEKIALGVVEPIILFMKVLSPIVIITSFITNCISKLYKRKDTDTKSVTEDELKAMVSISHEEGVIEDEEHEMINNIVEFGDCKVADIMIQRTDMILAPDSISYKELNDLFKEERFSRLPVYSENVDNIIGIVYLKDIVFINDTLNFDIKNHTRVVYFTYESKSTRELLIHMRTNKITMAVVLDEYGGTSGLVTLEDLVEEIIGDISDEYDEEELKIIKTDNREYIMDGSIKIEQVNEELGLSLESEDFDSIGGYVMGLFGQIPNNKDIIEQSNIKFIVDKAEKNKISKIKIILN